MIDSYEEMGAASVEEGQGDYQDKPQKQFKTMRAGVMKHEFLKILPWKGLVREFNLWNVFNESLHGVRFIECSSYQELTVFMNLIFPSLLSLFVRKCK